MRTLPMAKLGFILNSLNHNLRFRAAGNKAMLYVYQPVNEFGNQRGLVDVCAFPNPAKYPSFPKWDFVDYTGRKARGYANFFKILVKNKLVSPAKLSLFVPDWQEEPPKDYALPKFEKPKPKSMEEFGVDFTSGLPAGFTYSGKEMSEDEKAAHRARLAA